MGEDNKTVDYMASINKARRRRKRPPYGKYAAIAIGCVLVIGGIFLGAKTLLSKDYDEAIVAEDQVEQDAEAAAVTAVTIDPEEEKAQIRDAEAQAIIDSYSNLGIIQVSGYLNIRENPESGEQVVGKLIDGSACEILETLDGWYKVTSGGIEGYISADYVLTGDEAKHAALSLITDRAVVTTDNLNIRKEPSTESDVVGQCLEGEKYEIIGETEGWYQIPSGYISADYAEKEFSLNEARRLDMRAMVLNYYEKPGVSNVSNYLNIRQKPGTEEKIIGKLPSYAGCEILEELDGWYKIRSGNLTGYVSSDYILTGDAARQAAMEHAELMAIVNTDVLNARTEPTTEAKIWTQITNNERYHVADQLDGWIKIEFDESGENGEAVTAYVSSEYVDVRYALDEAIKFSPAEENASLRSRIVNYALKFLGNPYVWGGTILTKGADCSGFTLSVFKNFGISLPHYSGSQAQMGTAVKSNNMRPGDLIFYGNSSGTINHVAMYIGNGQVVHAASKKSGIKISTWNYRKPLKIRDIIGNRQ
ncbi:MAG: SH3 domain-containing protein [Lachnospiraceae bacterium]|nr:SH3 domain-containing protein [Lachnospiraceae bacterium]